MKEEFKVGVRRNDFRVSEIEKKIKLLMIVLFAPVYFLLYFLSILFSFDPGYFVLFISFVILNIFIFLYYTLKTKHKYVDDDVTEKDLRSIRKYFALSFLVMVYCPIVSIFYFYNFDYVVSILKYMNYIESGVDNIFPSMAFYKSQLETNGYGHVVDLMFHVWALSWISGFILMFGFYINVIPRHFSVYIMNRSTIFERIGKSIRDKLLFIITLLFLMFTFSVISVFGMEIDFDTYADSIYSNRMHIRSFEYFLFPAGVTFFVLFYFFISLIFVEIVFLSIWKLFGMKRSTNQR